ncbi:MAG: hypothetical protein AB7I41_14010 [Candidatus Sericytochromatia bacterium]
MNKVQHILDEIAELEHQERENLFQQLIDFDAFKTRKKVAQQKSALSGLIGMGSSGHSQNNHDEILAQTEMKANQ